MCLLKTGQYLKARLNKKQKMLPLLRPFCKKALEMEVRFSSLLPYVIIRRRSEMVWCCLFIDLVMCQCTLIIPN